MGPGYATAHDDKPEERQRNRPDISRNSSKRSTHVLCPLWVVTDRSFKDSLTPEFIESPFDGIGRSEHTKTILVLPIMSFGD